MLRIGLWATARDLVAAPHLHRHKPALHLRVRRTWDGREQLADLLVREPYLEVVIPEPLHRFDPIADHLRERSIAIFVVPQHLFADTVQLLALQRAGPVKIAATLARFPAMASFRHALQRLPIPDPDQLTFPHFT